MKHNTVKTNSNSRDILRKTIDVRKPKLTDHEKQVIATLITALNQAHSESAISEDGRKLITELTEKSRRGLTPKDFIEAAKTLCRVGSLIELLKNSS